MAIVLCCVVLIVCVDLCELMEVFDMIIRFSQIETETEAETISKDTVFDAIN